MNQPEFFQQHAVDGILPDHLMAQMLALPEGDMGLGVSPALDGSPTVTTEEPAAPTPAPAAPAATPAPAEPQVILARDGVHTIPFERLQEARELAQQAQQRAEEAARQAAALAEENERLRAAATPSSAPAPAQTPAPAPAEGEGLFGDYSDTAIAKGVETLIAARTATLTQQIATLQQQLTPVQQAAEISANEAHWRTIYGAHPDLDSLVESAELKAWIDKQPTFLQAAYENVLNQGEAPQVVELFNAYKTANGIPLAGTTQAPAAAPVAAASPAAAAVAQAAAAIARAPAVVPSSLSEIPAGASAHHDPAAAMLEMSPLALMNAFEGKSPEQIQAALNKVL